MSPRSGLEIKKEKKRAKLELIEAQIQGSRRRDKKVPADDDRKHWKNESPYNDKSNKKGRNLQSLFIAFCNWLRLGLGPHLFVKVPRPGDSEVTFAVFESYDSKRFCTGLEINKIIDLS